MSRLALVALCLTTGCATSLVKRDIQRQSDGWTVTFHELLDGPNGFTSRGGTDHVPKSGLRFVWVVLSVRNDGASPRAFNFDACGLDLDDGASLPLYVGMNIGTSAQTNGTPELAAGETIKRKLAYGYPKGQVPSRLDCFGNRIDLAGGG